MASTNEKKDKFNIAINHYAEEQRKKIEDEIAAFKKEELSEAEIEILTECYLMIQKEMAQMRTGILKETAARETDLKRQLLEKRQKITDDVFKRAGEQLAEFTKTDQYADFLRKAAEQFAKALQQQDSVIFIRPVDEKYEGIIRGAFQHSCSFQTSDRIRIGGIKARNESMGLLADNTLDTLLENQRKWFEEQSGMTVV